MFLKTLRIERIHMWAFYLLCGFGLFSNISIAAANVFLGLLTAVVLLRLWRKHDDWLNALPDGQLGRALLILMGAVVLSSLLSDDISHSLRTAGDYYGYRLLALYAVLLMIREKRQLALIAVCVGISLAVNDLAIIFQGLFQGNLRAAGFSFYMSVGGFLSMLVPALLVLLLSGRLPAAYHAPGWVVFALSLAALYYNGTRGAWLAAVISALAACALLVQQKKKFLSGVLCAALVFLGVGLVSPHLSERLASIGDMKVQSNSERLLLWTSASRMFADHPIAGIGFAGFKKAYQEQYILPEAKERELGHAHSNVMHMLAECGIIGVAALLFFWWTYLSYGVRTWMRRRHLAALLLAAILFGLFLQGLTEYNMGNSAVMKLYGLLTGLCLQWLRLDESMQRRW